MFAVWAANLPAVIPRAALKGLAAFWAGDSNFGHGALRQRHEKNKKTKPLQTICLFFFASKSASPSMAAISQSN